LSAIGGIFARTPRDDLAAQMDRLLLAMAHRGSEIRDVLTAPAWTLGVSRFAWEETDRRSGAARVRASGDVSVVADASLYYRDDLRRALQRERVPCDSEDPTELVLAAYKAWGAECARFLEGDFAFIIADTRRQRVLLSRDHVGRRPLHLFGSPSLLVVGSSARAVGTHPLVQAPVNLVAIAAAISGLLGGSRETGFEGVVPVEAGTTWEWSADRGLQKVWSWRAPTFRIGGKSDIRESGEALRELLVTAVAERMDSGTTAIWLSGGADSTAVFGTGSEGVRRGIAPVGARLQPVTVSYPEGDQAREDHHVQAIAARWNSNIVWIDSESVDLFEDLEQRARVRDDPYAHTFEMMNRRLARASLSAGARVAFDGYGGDQLFLSSEAYLADLFVRLQWRELRASMAAHGYHGVRGFVRWCLVPWLPEPLFDWIQTKRKRGAGTQGGLNVPPWLAPRWTSDAALRRRRAPEPSRRFLESPSQYESRWYVETPYFPRAVSWASAIALETGVEMRSPLLDQRIIRFAASRPVSERGYRGEGKRVLRESVRSLIPDSVTAHRPVKTGIPRGYLHRRMKAGFREALGRVFGSQSSALVAAGLLDAEALRRSTEEYLSTEAHILGVQLFLTLQGELWLRSVSGFSEGSG
jgi:asparagine synthase (glutamine-hydrolysing)